MKPEMEMGACILGRSTAQPAASAVPSSGSWLMENPWYSWPPPMW